MPTISTHRARFEELKKNPLLFLRREDNSYQNWKGDWIEDISWVPMDSDFSSQIKADDFSEESHYCLVIAREEIKKEKKDDSEDNDNSPVEFNVEAVNANSISDWIIIINSYIIRSRDNQDKYPYIHLLWFLNHKRWHSDKLIEALEHYDVQSLPFIFNVFSSIGRCLSLHKQKYIQQSFAHYNNSYVPYTPSIIPEAIQCANPSLSNNGYYNNLFSQIDYVLCTNIEKPVQLSITPNTSNPLLRLYLWLNSNEEDIDYNLLISLFSLVNIDTQFDIVKRYFHDIRLGKTSFDQNLFNEFRDNKFADFIRFRYCIDSPEEPVNLGVAFLCDCVQTIQQTQGKSFQSFDGILDFAMSHCDVTKPSIRLGMDKFIPQCLGGAVYNSEFLGFIDYGIVYRLDETRFTEENLKASIMSMLSNRPKHRYYACRYDNSPLSDQQLKNCIKEFKDHTKRSCFTTLPYDDKWVVKRSDSSWLNFFLKDPIPELGQYEKDSDIIIDFSQTSTEVLMESIKTMAEQFEKVGDGLFLLRSHQLRRNWLLQEYSKAELFRIYPKNCAAIGIKYDVFGLLDSLLEERNKPRYPLTDDIKAEYYNRESSEVYRRVVESLKKEFDTNVFNDEYFEQPFDRDMLRKILGLYYFKGVYPKEIKESERSFLTDQNRRSTPFCAPKLAEAHNKATDLPFFWCRGTECFHNSLKGQVLVECDNWKNYSLYHLIEIIGYPKLHLTEGGYEPDPIVTEFIAVANRVIKKFKRLKCRSCGHLMYTDWSSGYNRYNYYSCINPTCAEYGIPVYLSYCFKCKKGLIDSRDSKQCPNGWYICPTCHSCCDDAQYERQAQRYIVSQRPVPDRIKKMLGKGHNDKGIFFCHKCGTELQQVPDRESGVLGCPTCHIVYDENYKE